MRSETRDTMLVIVIGVLLSIMIVGSLILFTPFENNNLTISEDVESYVLVNGDFNYIDVYSWALIDGAEPMTNLNAHITEKDILYSLSEIYYDYDSTKDFAQFEIWIFYTNGTFTTTMLKITTDSMYTFLIYKVEFEMYITK